jgi:ribosome-associated protein
LTPKTLAKKIAHLALTKKAHTISILDLRKLTDMTDFFVVCSGDSDVQVKAISDAIIDGTERLGVPPWHHEGMTQRQWILLDYVDVVVHVFHREARKYYALEKLWGDAKIEAVEDKPEPKPPARKPKPKKLK